MTRNMGRTDRIIRVIVGLVLVLAPLFSGLELFAAPLLLWASVLVGAILIVTASLGSCPLYTPFGFSTRKASSK